MNKHLVVVLVMMLALTCAHSGVAVRTHEADVLQSEVGRTTIERLNAMLQHSVAGIAQHVPVGPIVVRVVQHPDAEVIRVLVMNNLRQGTTISTSETGTELLITPVDVSTRYEATEAPDSLDRVLSVALKAVLTEHGNARVLAVEPLTERERLHRNDAVRLQSMQRSSTYAQLPPMTTTFWDDVLQPAIFVVAAVTTVVLLFTVRSQ